MNKSINYISSVTQKDISDITMNGSFPLLKITNNFDKKESSKIINAILEETKKEKNDDFPYSLAYQDQLQINFCIKNHKFFNFLNIFTFGLIMVNSIIYQ